MLQSTTQDATSPLKDAVRRAMRGEFQPWVALALHLSRLQPPAPRPHHLRIARTVLEDAAARREGQLFTLLNGDLVLLFPASDAGVGLATTLGQLFAPDAPDATLLLSRWLLPANMDELFALLDAVTTLAAAPVAAEADSNLAAVARLTEVMEPSRVRDVMERRTGILVATAGSPRVVPLFRELGFSATALEARAAASGHVTADPFLFRHLVDKLGGAMREATITDLHVAGGLLEWAVGGRLTLHLNMSVDAVLSPALDLVAEAAAEVGARIAVEIALVEACADMRAFDRARARLRAAGFGVVLDDVSHHALMMIRPTSLQADLLKLDWSRQLLQCGDPLDAAIAAISPAQIILQGADVEEAMRWGIAHGIRRFQGRHVGNMLGAGRMEVCAFATQCTLRACVAREAATTNAGRSGCNDLALLDAALPSRKQAA